jgi:hypothetical protein
LFQHLGMSQFVQLQFLKFLKLLFVDPVFRLVGF